MTDRTRRTHNGPNVIVVISIAVLLAACNEGAGGGGESCDFGYVEVDGTCVPGFCVDDGDCDDSNPCNGSETCAPDRSCRATTPVQCGEHAYCQPSDGECVCATGYTGDDCAGCDDGYVKVEGECLPGTCSADGECDDGLACNGLEQCGLTRSCIDGTAVACAGRANCVEPGGDCECVTGWVGEDCDTCDDGYVLVIGECLLAECTTDGECDDGLACNGAETCEPSTGCQLGTPVECATNAGCVEPSGDCECSPGYILGASACIATVCEIPQAPTLSIIHAGAVLQFTTAGSHALEVGTSTDPSAPTPDAWLAQHWLDIPAAGTPLTFKAFARVDDPSCLAEEIFEFVFEVRDGYPPVASDSGTTAISMSDPTIVAWATGWIDPVQYGTDVATTLMTPELATGPALGTATDIVCLGRGGSITMTFDAPIIDGDGWDLVVFENSFSDTFLELAWVEVSTDGVTFLRFDNAFVGDSSVGGFGALDTTLVGSLAGKYIHGWGTPFDLNVFVNRPEVRDATVDLDDINFLRIVDVIGDGEARDSFEHVVYDPYPTVSSAGFDLEAIGVIHQAP